MNNCPKCGAIARRWSLFGISQRFSCGSHVDNGSVEFIQSWHCLATQRDALAAKVATLEARVKELEAYEAVCKDPEALWVNWLRGSVALPKGIGDVRALEERVKELEGGKP